MTVPSLMQNHQRKTYVTQLHKVYNELQQAALQCITDRNAINLTEAGINSQDAANNFIETYFKIVQKCEASLTPCFVQPEEFRTLNGTEAKYGHAVENSYVLSSGAAIRFDYLSSHISVLVDINGAKGPNIVGRDIFYMALYQDGRIDDRFAIDGPLDYDAREEDFHNCQSAASDWGCFGKILNDNWEMTY